MIVTNNLGLFHEETPSTRNRANNIQPILANPQSLRSKRKLKESKFAQSIYQQIESLKKYIPQKCGLYSRTSLEASGFPLIDHDTDTAKCTCCQLEISTRINYENLWDFHRENSPTCDFVMAIRKPVGKSQLSSPIIHSRNAHESLTTEHPSKRQKTELLSPQDLDITLKESKYLQSIRERTFSHWQHRNSPTKAQMIEAGFFGCNVGDRVICIYCNLICQQWTPHVDDPCEVHKTLKPNCIFVKSLLVNPNSSIIILNDNSIESTSNQNESPLLVDTNTIRSDQIVYTKPCNAAYSELPRRQASFANWSTENLPSPDDLARAGFFYSGIKTIVTCFYCNGSLQNWGPTDNPMIEHARWFPYCSYAKQLCGENLYRKIQESKRAHQERQRANEMRQRNENANNIGSTTTQNSERQLITDESTLSRLVAARLDLEISQRLLSYGFKLSIIKRCWEDQLRLKQDDFVTETDLFMACTILQKQIEHIDGKKENIIIPSVRMKQFREQQESNSQNPSSTSTASSNFSTSNNTNLTRAQTASNETKLTSESSQKSIETLSNPKKSQPTPMNDTKSEASETVANNLCVLCWTEEKRLACMPCGHIATCVPCGHSLRSCPICRREIKAFVRVYM